MTDGRSLEDRLADADWEIRRDAVRELAALDDPAAWQCYTVALINLLKELAPTVQSLVIDMLVRLGEPALVTLLDHPDGDNAGMRGGMAKAFGAFGDVRAMPRLLRWLADDNAYVRTSAAIALGDVGDESAVPALARRVDDEDEFARRFAVVALAKIGGEGIPLVAERMRHPDAQVRRDVAQALAGCQDARAVPALIEGLGDEDDAVRSQSAFALTRVGDERAIPALIACLRRDRMPRVRSHSAWALAEIGGDSAVPDLIHSLSDTSMVDWDRTVRDSVVAALRIIKTPLALAALEAWQSGKGFRPTRFLAEWEAEHGG